MGAVARLLSWFDAAGCRGAVLAGTNGEGPSLGAVEKRDLIRDAVPLAGGLELILGISTPSSDEAVWLSKQAHAAGAAGVLLMAPGYFREATPAGIEAWFRFVMDRSPSPIFVYNFPKRTGFELTPELLSSLSSHGRFSGVKDSSGERSNLSAYRQAVTDHPLFVGDETLLLEALRAGWTGSISGAANVVPSWLASVIAEYPDSGARFDLLLPVLEAIRKAPQPGTHKTLLHRWGILPNPDLRLPLMDPPTERVDEIEGLIERTLGRRGGL